MRYIVAFFIPWLGFITIGRFGAAVFAFLLQLSIIGWPIAWWWSLLSIAAHNADKRTDRIVNAIRDTQPKEPDPRDIGRSSPAPHSPPLPALPQVVDTPTLAPPAQLSPRPTLEPAQPIPSSPPSDTPTSSTVNPTPVAAAAFAQKREQEASSFKPSPKPPPEPEPSADERPPVFRWPQDEEPPAQSREGSLFEWRTKKRDRASSDQTVFRDPRFPRPWLVSDPKTLAIAALLLIVVFLGGTLIEVTNPKLLTGAPKRTAAYVENLFVSKPCMFHQATMPSGTAIVAYKTSSIAPRAECQGEVRQCRDGTLSGSFQHLACTAAAAPVVPPPPPPPRGCPFARTVIAHGATVDAYKDATVPQGQQCLSQTRYCNDGSLTGSWTHLACSVQSAPTPKPLADCRLSGAPVKHYASITAFKEATVSHISQCSSETRLCLDGALTGSYTNLTCTPGSTGVSVPTSNTQLREWADVFKGNPVYVLFPDTKLTYHVWFRQGASFYMVNSRSQLERTGLYTHIGDLFCISSTALGRTDTCFDVKRHSLGWLAVGPGKTSMLFYDFMPVDYPPPPRPY